MASRWDLETPSAPLSRTNVRSEVTRHDPAPRAALTALIADRGGAEAMSNSGSPENIVSGDIDLQGFNSAEVVAYIGDIDELGGSPVGNAKIELKLEHAADDGTGSPGTYSNVALADVIGPSSMTSGIVASTTSDETFLEVGYRGGRRFLRTTLIPTGLSNAGPIAAWVERGHPRHGPQ